MFTLRRLASASASSSISNKILLQKSYSTIPVKQIVSNNTLDCDIWKTEYKRKHNCGKIRTKEFRNRPSDGNEIFQNNNKIYLRPPPRGISASTKHVRSGFSVLDNPNSYILDLNGRMPKEIDGKRVWFCFVLERGTAIPQNLNISVVQDNTRTGHVTIKNTGNTEVEPHFGPRDDHDLSDCINCTINAVQDLDWKRHNCHCVQLQANADVFPKWFRNDHPEIISAFKYILECDDPFIISDILDLSSYLPPKMIPGSTFNVPNFWELVQAHLQAFAEGDEFDPNDDDVLSALQYLKDQSNDVMDVDDSKSNDRIDLYI